MKKTFKSAIYLVAIAVIVLIGVFVYRADYSHPAAAHKEKVSQIKKNVTKTAIIELKNGNKIVTDKIPVTKGETALQELESYTSSHHIEMAVTGSGKMAYVTSLENIKAGGKKGWMFSVNGKEPTVGAGATVVKPDETIVWYYTQFK